ncbi:hypothetical protein OG936_32805 [Streptomyces sp. NBC_00846]|nr:hypothetical protein OG936_32805 [Streptomyces sp. NBC_00846]
MALLVVPEQDAVIPDGVTELLRTVPATRVDWPTTIDHVPKANDYSSR